MRTVIRAVYKNGVFKPLENIPLEDNQEVILHIETVKRQSDVVELGNSWSFQLAGEISSDNTPDDGNGAYNPFDQQNDAYADGTYEEDTIILSGSNPLAESLRRSAEIYQEPSRPQLRQHPIEDLEPIPPIPPRPTLRDTSTMPQYVDAQNHIDDTPSHDYAAPSYEDEEPYEKTQQDTLWDQPPVHHQNKTNVWDPPTTVWDAPPGSNGHHSRGGHNGNHHADSPWD